MVNLKYVVHELGFGFRVGKVNKQTKQLGILSVFMGTII